MIASLFATSFLSLEFRTNQFLYVLRMFSSFICFLDLRMLESNLTLETIKEKNTKMRLNVSVTECNPPWIYFLLRDTQKSSVVFCLMYSGQECRREVAMPAGRSNFGGSRGEGKDPRDLHYQSF